MLTVVHGEKRKWGGSYEDLRRIENASGSGGHPCDLRRF